jgi:hypothetical protein
LQGGAAWAAALSEAKITAAPKRYIARGDADVPATIRDAAFDVPRVAASGVVQYRGIATENGDYAVIAVGAVKAGTVENGTPESAAKLREAAQDVGGEELRAYIADAESKSKIERNPKAFE